MQRDRGVLVVAVNRAGDTRLRQKPGAMLLLTESGAISGSMAGQEFVKDLLNDAEQWIDAEGPGLMSYSLHEEYLRYLGDGEEEPPSLDVLYYPLNPENNYAPVLPIFDRVQYGEGVTFSCVTETTHEDWQLGDYVLQDNVGDVFASNRPDKSVIPDQVAPFHFVIDPPLHLLIFGGGAPSRPLVRLARTMGWRISLVEDRPECLEAEWLSEVDHLLELSPDDLESVPVTRFAVIMPHDFDKELAYLEELAQRSMKYIGLAGVRERADKLLFTLAGKSQEAAERIGPVVRAPAGLTLGGDDDAAIALAITAEIQQIFAG